MIKRKLISKCIVALLTATVLLVVWKTRDRRIGVADRQLLSQVSSNHSQVSQKNGKHKPSVSVKERLDDRKILIESLCREREGIGGHQYEITGNKIMNVSYCVIPKAGCTMWLRIFKYLSGQKFYSGSPMKISKFEVHYRDSKRYKRFDLKKVVDHQFVRHSLRVVTVRDPWTRLWSAYIDKLLLPDFWFTKGRQIVRMVRQHASNQSLTCGHDVTFSEFVQYVINMGHSMTFINQDKHWLPASDLCNPCVYKPDIIAKQETFLDDLTYVLKNREMDEMISKIKSTNHTEYEILDEIKYNFAIYKRYGRCITILELCKRMWTAFKFNGYIPQNETFNESVMPLNETTFFELIIKIRIKNKMTKDDTKRLRKTALIQAYSRISQTYILALKELYIEDFKYFNYERSPPCK